MHIIKIMFSSTALHHLFIALHSNLHRQRMMLFDEVNHDEGKIPVIIATNRHGSGLGSLALTGAATAVT